MSDWLITYCDNNFNNNNSQSHIMYLNTFQAAVCGLIRLQEMDTDTAVLAILSDSGAIILKGEQRKGTEGFSLQKRCFECFKVVFG